VARTPAGGTARAGQAVTDAAIRTASDAAAMAQADTVSDDRGSAAKGTEGSEALPAG
jgi:hypothetical protein